MMCDFGTSTASGQLVIKEIGAALENLQNQSYPLCALVTG